MLGLHSESVIQDVDIPISRAAEFLDFYAREIALWPQWVCPIGPQANSGRFVLYPVKNTWYVNFGFWDVKRTREAHPPGHFNRLIEEKVSALGGIKSLYSELLHRGGLPRALRRRRLRRAQAQVRPRRPSSPALREMRSTGLSSAGRQFPGRSPFS